MKDGWEAAHSTDSSKSAGISSGPSELKHVTPTADSAPGQPTLFDPIRKRPEFAELQQAGVKCQESFPAHRHGVSDAMRSFEKLN
jgi:hypothetical protein